MLSGGAVVVFLFADIKFRRKISTKIRWKYGMILLAMLAGKLLLLIAPTIKKSDLQYTRRQSPRLPDAQLRRNVAAEASRWRHCVWFDRLGN